SKRNNRGITPSFLSMAGISVGVMALVSVLSVMNGLQLGFIEDILEINSYHLRLSFTEEVERNSELKEAVESLKEVEALVPFKDTQTLIQGEYSDYHSVLVRGLEPSSAGRDRDFIDHLNLVEGGFSFDVDGEPGIVMGRALARRLGLSVGDRLDIVTMRGSDFSSLRPQHASFVLSGLFHSGYYQYDSSYCFVDLQNYRLLDSSTQKLVYGIKLHQAEQDRRAVESIQRLLRDRLRSEEDYELVSWRRYNRSFFSALRVEKLTMMILLGLIFAVVALNIRGALERTVMEKREEIGILRALGASSLAVRQIFLIEGLLIGIGGSVIGLLLGLVLSLNINTIFEFMEELSLRLSVIGAGSANQLYSSTKFYLDELPVRVLFSDVYLIVLFAVGASLLAALAASKRISEYNPTEILRYENE
ncbi:MAG TPA: ABC transporter permease, partial [Sediminispirochaeta sp.]|nr:ABC transporter permease [Sediminispirochaeta sp.]